ELILILQEIDRCRGYHALGKKSLYDYARSLGLSESVTYNLITIARKSVEVPKLQEMIASQEITVSNARMVATVITKENQDQWLEAAANLSKRELEKEIATAKPESAPVPERTRYVTSERMELKLGISQELEKKLRRAQDLVSSKTKRSVTLEETLA